MSLLYVALLNLIPGPIDTTKAENIGQVTVKASSKKETVSSVINVQRKSLVIMDAVSSESIKKTPDRTIGDVLKRVGGTSIQNDKFVVIRGLSDRYNSVLVNGSLIGSTEPDKKSFSFDLIPSNTIDNLIVYKTASPDLPGDFSGGVIKLTTKVVDSKSKSFDFGLSYGTLSSFRNSWTLPSYTLPNNFLTTKEFRSLPSEIRKIESQKIIEQYQLSQSFNIPNLTMVYNQSKMTKKFSYLTNITLRNSRNITTTERKDYMSGNDLMFNYTDKVYTNTTNLGTIINLKYKKYDLKNTINYLNENSVTNRNGVNYDNEQLITSSSSNHNKKFILMSQFVTPRYSLNYTLLHRSQPDYRVNPFAKNISSNGDSTFIWRDSYRFWSTMNEHTFGGYYNDTIGKFKYGVYEQLKYRNFGARVFRYEPNYILSEITNNTDKYNAFSNLFAGYGMYTKTYNKFTASGGIRIENQIFKVNTYDFSGRPQQVDRNYLDLLPSLNLIYGVTSNKNIRLSLSKTVARPEFREVSNFSFYDFVRNAQVIGNTNLSRTQITNIDLRYEIYPTSKEIITFSTFYKRFVKPIEQIVDNGSVPSNLILTLSNPNLATIYGGELEIRKSINNNFTIYSNLSYFKSEVNIQGRTRQLQGQSPYIINTGLFYTKGKYSVNMFYNRIGERISAVGFQGYPDIYENARDVIDMTVQYQTKKMSIKFGISDLLGQYSKFYQTNQDRTLIKTNNEQTINLTINYKL